MSVFGSNFGGRLWKGSWGDGFRGMSLGCLRGVFGSVFAVVLGEVAGLDIGETVDWGVYR